MSQKEDSEKKSERIVFYVTPSVRDEITALAKAYGFSDNRSKFIELAVTGLLKVERKKLEN